MIILHPTNCECEYDFPHSLIITTRTVKVRDGSLFEVRTTMIVCRACDHWIVGKPNRCRCPFECHSAPGGVSVDTKPVSTVNCP